MTPTRPAPRPPLAGTLLVGLLCGVAALHPAHAGSTFGSLANFDAVNDTGKSAYGFEIEFEDAHFFKSQVGSVFGLNRVFPSVSPNPLAVVRFGSVRVEDYNDALGNHAGVHIIYGGTPGGVFTPANNPASPFHTPGESCWPGANRGWASNPCDHFGVTTAGSPALTRYSWLVQSAANPGVLERQALGIPAVNFVYTPPPPPPPPPPPGAPPPPPPPPAILDVQIRAVAPNPEQPENIALWGDPYWVKTYTTKVPRNIDLGNLLRGDPDVEAAEVETEWSIFQRAPAGHVGANEVKEVQLQLGDADKSVIRRYEFFHYTGPLNVDGSGEVDCNTGCEVDPLGLDANQDHFGQSFVGNFVGAQMAGFNVNQAAAVPEPQTWAAMLGGLAVLGLRLRRRTR